MSSFSSALIKLIDFMILQINCDPSIIATKEILSARAYVQDNDVATKLSMTIMFKKQLKPLSQFITFFGSQLMIYVFQVHDIFIVNQLSIHVN